MTRKKVGWKQKIVQNFLFAQLSQVRRALAVLVSAWQSWRWPKKLVRNVGKFAFGWVKNSPKRTTLPGFTTRLFQKLSLQTKIELPLWLLCVCVYFSRANVSVCLFVCVCVRVFEALLSDFKLECTIGNPRPISASLFCVCVCFFSL